MMKKFAIISTIITVIAVIIKTIKSVKSDKIVDGWCDTDRYCI